MIKDVTCLIPNYLVPAQFPAHYGFSEMLLVHLFYRFWDFLRGLQYKGLEEGSFKKSTFGVSEGKQKPVNVKTTDGKTNRCLSKINQWGWDPLETQR